MVVIVHENNDSIELAEGGHYSSPSDVDRLSAQGPTTDSPRFSFSTNSKFNIKFFGGIDFLSLQAGF